MKKHLTSKEKVIGYYDENGKFVTQYIIKPGSLSYRDVNSKNKPKDADLQNITRAGIVPYYIYNKKVYYEFFIDFNYQQITDAGGKIDYRKDGNNILHTAKREYEEESLNVISYSYLDTENVVFLISLIDNTLIILMKIYKPINLIRIRDNYRKDYENKVTEELKKAKQNLVSIENSFLIWITDEILRELSFEKGYCSTNIRLPPDDVNFIKTSYVEFLDKIEKERNEIKLSKKSPKTPPKGYCNEEILLNGYYPTIYSVIRNILNAVYRFECSLIE